MQFDIFPDRMFLKREHPAKNIRRFYALTIQPDLFGGVSLVREWGRIGMAGKVRIDPYPDEGRAIDALARLMQAKKKRGYQ